MRHAAPWKSVRFGTVAAGPVLAVLLCAVEVCALDPTRAIDQYVHAVWRVDQGLPHNAVTSIVQSDDGYLWLSTYDGIARFDGIQFRNYDLIELLDLENNSINALARGENGRLWIAASAGLVCYHEGKFVRVPIPWNALEFALTVVFEDRSGNIWVGTRRGGVWRRSAGSGEKWTRISGLSSTEVRAIQQDKTGKVWIATTGGLDYCAGGGTEASATPIAPLLGQYLLSVMEDSSGRLWVGTRNAGLFIVEAQVATPYRLPGGADSNTIVTIVEDRDKTFWLGTLGGVYRFNGKTFDLFGPDQGLSHTNVRALFVDHEGSLWIGTNGGGMNVLRDGRFVPTTEKQGLSSNVVMSVYEDPSGALWLATNGKGVNRLKDGKVTTLTTRDGLSNDNSWTICGDRKGNLWIGSYGGGVDRYAGGKVQHFTTREGLTGDDITALFVDSRDDLWVGTREGLSRIAGATVQAYSTANGMPHENVRAIAEDPEGSIWVGTYGGGMLRLRGGKFESWKKSEGLPSNYVLTLHFDDAGCLWIGTMGGGLAVMKNGRISVVNRKVGFPVNSVYTILDDDNGNVWMSNANGVYRVAKRALLDASEGIQRPINFVHYTGADGLPSGGCQGGYQPAAWKGRDGVLYFPTIQGLASIDPRKERPNPVPPPVNIDEVIVDGKSFPPTSQNAVFPPGNGDVEFRFAGLSLAAPERVRFRYILENTKRGWVEVEGRRFAAFNIGPGEYRFRVIACNRDGVWNTTGASFSFRLEPHFYQTRMFQLMCILSGLAAAFGAYRWRVQALKRHQAELARQVEKAMAEIKVLSGLLPICSACKKVRDDHGYWNTLETYISSHSQAQFTHGICPQCMNELYPELTKPHNR